MLYQEQFQYKSLYEWKPGHHTEKLSSQVEKKSTNITLMLDENNKSQMFGAISDFNIWDRILTWEEIQKWSQCQLDTKGNILNWNDFNIGKLKSYKNLVKK